MAQNRELEESSAGLLPGDDVDALLDEQIRYYRARAPEYDDWWERRAQHDLGPRFAASWAAEADQLRASLRAFAPRADVLELAAGTGILTAEVLRHAESVTAIDSSPEVLELNAERNGTKRVRHVVTNLFEWEPPRQWAHIVFGFWISHVPAARWEQFWAVVDGALAPGGRVWFCDNAHEDHVIRRGPPEVQGTGDAANPFDGERRGRRLSDGRMHTIIKRYWTPRGLEADLAGLGWRANVANTDWAFMHGTARRLKRG